MTILLKSQSCIFPCTPSSVNESIHLANRAADLLATIGRCQDEPFVSFENLPFVVMEALDYDTNAVTRSTRASVAFDYLIYIILRILPTKKKSIHLASTTNFTANVHAILDDAHLIFSI